MAEELGIETAISEAVPEGPDAERVIRDYAQKGYNVIVATSFGYMDSVMNVAKDYPDVTFLHATGYQTADNVGIYDGRGYQGWYLAGIVAGKMTKTNSPRLRCAIRDPRSHPQYERVRLRRALGQPRSDRHAHLD